MIFISGSSPAVPQVHQHTSHVPQPQVSPVYLHQTQSQPQFLTTPSASFPQPSIPQALAAPDFHQADGQALQSVSFEYSRCTGRRKALCIGINYLGQPNELRGCINDAKRVRDFLYHPRRIPTRENIIDAMRWLVRSAKQDDSLFFHYSGHGGQTPDLDGDEVDGYDETIFPVDYQQAGQIIDDTMHEIMVKPLPRGCRLTALFDCCHSGSALDLPYIYSSSGRLKGSHVTSRAQRRKYSPADVISFSGCEDGQTSADTFAGGVAVGAMSHAFMTSLRNHPKQSYHGLLRSVREILYPQYSQKPQLASSHHIDTGLEFVF
ncbi:hypothetical protein ONZ45_g19081 [Pleurotus djamor]|nr:hypothetical protein ONZ45_g19081 [Pleurotus djamor]